VLCVSLGLRISECLALKWSDVDWLNGTAASGTPALSPGELTKPKTEGSRRALTLAAEILVILRAWKMSTQFGDAK